MKMCCLLFDEQPGSVPLDVQTMMIASIAVVVVPS
jgi:hypothetical protein